MHQKYLRTEKQVSTQVSWALCIAKESGYIQVFRGGKKELKRRLRKSLTPHKGFAYFVKIQPKKVVTE